MKTMGILLLTLAAVGLISWALICCGSWLICAGMCAVLLLVLLMLEGKHEL